MQLKLKIQISLIYNLVEAKPTEEPLIRIRASFVQVAGQPVNQKDHFYTLHHLEIKVFL